MQRNATSEGGRARSDKVKLTPKQESAILALLTEPTLEEAAKRAGVNRTTLFRWHQNKDFHDAYMKARRDSVRQAIARLQSKTTEAVDVLAEIMNNSAANDFARVGAAKAIIEYSIKAVEIEDLAQRVEELEGLINASPQK